VSSFVGLTSLGAKTGSNSEIERLCSDVKIVRSTD
jgi:hypothetical protein